MKKFLIVNCTCFLILFSLGFTSADIISANETGKKVEILFNANTGFTELGLIQAQCDKIGIRIVSRKIEYDEAGRLQSLSIKVD